MLVPDEAYVKKYYANAKFSTAGAYREYVYQKPRYF